MPIVQITLVHGRSNEAVERCIREVARTVSKTLDAPQDSVRVMVSEVPKSRFAIGDRLKSDAASRPASGTGPSPHQNPHD